MTNKQFCNIVEQARKGDEKAFYLFYEAYFSTLLIDINKKGVDTTLIHNMAKEVIWKVYQKYVIDEFECSPDFPIDDEVTNMMESVIKNSRKKTFFKAWSLLSDDCKTALSNYSPSSTNKTSSKCFEEFKNNF